MHAITQLNQLIVESNSSSDKNLGAKRNKISTIANGNLNKTIDSSKKIRASIPETKSIIVDNLDACKSSSFPETTDEKIAASKKFEVGDIIVTNIAHSTNKEYVDSIIKLIQKISKFLGFADKNANSSSIHVAIVVAVDKENGKVIISEAMPSRGSGLRTVDLFNHNSCALGKNSPYQYQIFRPKPEHAKTSIKAAEIAKRLAPKASYLLSEDEKIELKNKQSEKSNRSKRSLITKFSFRVALKALFSKKRGLDDEAQKKVFKSIFEEAVESKVLISGAKRGRRIFCSAFISQIHQKAASEDFWKELLESNSSVKKEFEELKTKVAGRDNINYDKAVSKWAKKMQKEHGEELEAHLKAYKYDFMKMSPQDLIAHMKKNNIVDEAFTLVPPNS